MTYKLSRHKTDSRHFLPLFTWASCGRDNCKGKPTRPTDTLLLMAPYPTIPARPPVFRSLWVRPSFPSLHPLDSHSYVPCAYKEEMALRALILSTTCNVRVKAEQNFLVTKQKYVKLRGKNIQDTT